MRGIITKRVCALGLSAAILGAAATLPGRAYATESPMLEAAEICSKAESLGTLKDLKLSRADCMDALVGPSTPESRHQSKSLCAEKGIREKVDADDAAECVDRIQEILVIGA